MSLNDLITSIDNCDLGLVPSNLGLTESFLYGKKWYPIRAVVNHAAVIAGEPPTLTTHQALIQLTKLLFHIRVESIHFTANLPVELDGAEIITEARRLAKTLENLLQ